MLLLLLLLQQCEVKRIDSIALPVLHTGRTVLENFTARRPSAAASATSQHHSIRTRCVVVCRPVPGAFSLSEITRDALDVMNEPEGFPAIYNLLYGNAMRRTGESLHACLGIPWRTAALMVHRRAETEAPRWPDGRTGRLRGKGKAERNANGWHYWDYARLCSSVLYVCLCVCILV